jgi:cystathionine beta-lyase/cystathionine gamma-synthase
MMSIDLGSRSSANSLIRGLRHVPFSPSLGDVATTLSHPATTSHRTLSPEERGRLGIAAGLIRLSVGLEDVEDVWDDFRQALDGIED